MDPPDSEMGGSAEPFEASFGIVHPPDMALKKVQRILRSLMVVAGPRLGRTVALPPLKPVLAFTSYPTHCFIL